MATAEQLKSLIRSHFSDDSERFFTIVLQVAAHEAMQGHQALAHEIREIVEKAKREKHPQLLKFPHDFQALVLSEEPDTPMSALVVPTKLKDRVERIIHEYRQQHKLKSHGLSHRRKIMLIGPPGTGKTMTARVLAHELKLQLHTVQVDKLVTKFMGETSAKLRQIFELIEQEAGVYLFDEFDAIGGERTLGNDVGEMRRVLNAFLQFVEADSSANLIIVATNTPRLLDRALYRRFDDVIHYRLPRPEERMKLIANLLGTYIHKAFPFEKAANDAYGLSHSEIDRACRDAIKLAILENRNSVTYARLKDLIKERKVACVEKEIQ